MKKRKNLSRNWRTILYPTNTLVNLIEFIKCGESLPLTFLINRLLLTVSLIFVYLSCCERCLGLWIKSCFDILKLLTTYIGLNIMQVYDANNSISNYFPNENQTSSETGKSNNFSNIMSSVEAKATAETDSSNLLAMDTNQGHQKVNLDDLFSPITPSQAPVNLMDMPLLLPTAHNLEVLSKYSEAKFKDLMSEYDIPSPPATIKFDAEGQLVLPDDYPYASELKQAFAEHPEVERALSTTSALASHYAGIMEGAAFRDEMSTARSQTDQDRIVQKYSYLFDDNRPAAQIELAFTEDGDMLVGQSKV